MVIIESLYILLLLYMGNDIRRQNLSKVNPRAVRIKPHIFLMDNMKESVQISLPQKIFCRNNNFIYYEFKLCIENTKTYNILLLRKSWGSVVNADKRLGGSLYVFLCPHVNKLCNKSRDV